MRGHRHVAIWLGCPALMGGLVGGLRRRRRSGGGSSGGTRSPARPRARRSSTPRRWRARRATSTSASARTPRAPQQVVEQFNQENDAKGPAKLLEFPSRPTSSATSSSSASEAKRGECDTSTPTWSGPRSSRRRAGCMTDAVRRDAQGRVHPRHARTVDVRGQDWAVPYSSPTRRSSTTAPTRSKTPPTTWQEVYKIAAENDGIVYQGARLRGPDLQLPRDRSTPPAARCSPRTARRPSSTRPRSSRRCSSWSTASRTARRRRP